MLCVVLCVCKDYVNCFVGEMRPIFCGNFEYDIRQSDLEKLFRRYGKVDRVDMKSGNARSLVLAFYQFWSHFLSFDSTLTIYIFNFYGLMLLIKAFLFLH